jgi:ABC-type transport system involved in multi-copper enzyme maturation permease subunit
MTAALPEPGSRRTGPAPGMIARGFAAAALMLLGGLAVRAGHGAVVTAVVGAVAMATGFAVGLFVIRGLLGRASGVAGVAATVLDEAIRMRSATALVAVFIGLVPALPLLIDPTERLAYRVQFLIGWTLGGSGLILGLLTIFLACGSVCGDIESGRIHMTLSKPLHRWEYLVGKWLGIILYDLLLVVVAGMGCTLLAWLLARSGAVDAADRVVADCEVLVARRSLEPEPDRPEEYAAAIAAAIQRLEADDPEAFAIDPESARRRIRQEYAQQWHTVTADMETTFVFRGLGTRGDAGKRVQLQFEPRVTNVDVDLVDVRMAVWLNGRPWPMQDGRHVELTLASRARHVFDLPEEALAGSPDLRVRIANRNLVPPGETRPTAITLPPGDGMRLFVRVGGFVPNLVGGLLIMWAKLVLIAAVGVAAGAVFDLPLAILTSLVFFVTAHGSGFIGEALGSYNVVADSAWGRTVERMWYASRFIQAGRTYDAFRMLLGFVSDGLVRLLPTFSADRSVARLATGTVIPLGDVLRALLLFGIVYPLAVGLASWWVFDRRDLVRSSS